MLSELLPLMNKALNLLKLKCFLELFCVLGSGVSYVDPDIYKHCTSTAEVLKALVSNRYIHALQLNLLRTIVDAYGCDQCVKLLQEYETKLPKSAPLKRLHSELTEGDIESTQGFKRLRVEFQGNSDTCSFEDVERVQGALEKSSGVSRNAIVFARSDPGSVVLSFLVPENAVKSFTDIGKTAKRQSNLSEVGILSISIDELTFNVPSVQVVPTQPVDLSSVPPGAVPTVDESLGFPELQGYVNAGKKSLKIVITGKMGVGKSSLVNGLIGKEVTKEKMTPESVTLEIEEYKLKVHGVDTVIIDCPGFGDPMGTSDDETFSNIVKLCEDADVVIYCMDMRTRMSIADTNGMIEFTRRVGENIWTNAVFVLTHANEVPYPAKPIGWVSYLTLGFFGSSEDSERKTKFGVVFEAWKETIPKFLREKVLLSEYIASNIAIIPAGYRKFPPPDRVDWFSEFWCTVFSKVKESARPALLGMSLHRFKVGSGNASDEKNEELPINIPVKAGGTLAIGAGGGAALGALIGAAVGIVGGPAGVAVGVYAGALVGGGIGITSSGTRSVATALAIIISDVNENSEATKRKLKEA